MCELAVGDLYVGGNFHARVWSGTSFVDIFDLARYSGKVLT